MRITSSILCGIVVCLLASTASAQSTIANRPFDLTFGKGFMGTLMPGYELGTKASGGAAFADDLDSMGANWELKAVRRFLDTRTSFETRAFYGLSWSNQNSDFTDINVSNPLDGSNTALTGGRSHLSSDLDTYGFDFALRDTWQTRFGGLSAGMGFSYFAFDQDFDADYAQVRLLSESLDSDFLGGKGFVGWEGHVLGRATTLDLIFGYYDLEADYQLNGGAIAGSLSKTLADHSATIETRWTTWTTIGDWYAGLTLGGTYFTDMPYIKHNAGSQVTLGTTDAATIMASFEILL